MLRLAGVSGIGLAAGCSGSADSDADPDPPSTATEIGTGTGTAPAATGTPATTDSETATAEPTTFARPDGAVADAPLPSDPGSYRYATMGADDAPVTATLYGAWLCRHTARVVSNVLGPLVEEYVAPGSVRLRFRAVPYEGGDGFHGPVEPKMARAALAVWNEAPERYWTFFRYLFANARAADAWPADELARLARAAGVEAAGPIRAAYAGRGGYRDDVGATMERVAAIPVPDVPRVVVGDAASKPSVSARETRRQLDEAISGATGRTPGANETETETGTTGTGETGTPPG